MARSRVNAVKDQTTSGGPTSFVVAGVAPNGFLTCAAGLTDGRTYAMRIDNSDRSQWVIGDFTWTASTNTLALVTARVGSNGAGASVTFSGGTSYTIAHLATAEDFGLIVGNVKGSASGSQSFDYALGQIGSITLNGTTTISITGWPPSGYRGIQVIKITAGGSFTLNLPTTNWVNPDGSRTTTFATYLSNAGITLSANMNEFVFWTDDGGTTLYGMVR